MDEELEGVPTRELVGVRTLVGVRKPSESLEL